MSSTFSYPLAKTLLSEAEKERIVCTYLNTTDPNINVGDESISFY
jgi:hypothetical protein